MKPIAVDTNEPLVSVILPVVNAQECLSSCLESILSQSYSNIEIIAADDDSKDSSMTILRSFKHKDPRIKVIKNKQRYGIAVSLNRAMKKAHGQFITFLNACDTNALHRIRKQVAFLLANSKVVAVGTQCFFVNPDNKRFAKSAFPTEHEEIQQRFMLGASVQFESLLINRTLLPKDLLKFKDLAYPLLFNEVFLKLFHYGKFANLTQYLYYHKRTNKHRYRQPAAIKHLISRVDLWIKWLSIQENKLPINTLLTPLLTPFKQLEKQR